MSLEQIVANLVQKIEHRFYGKYRGLVVDNADPEQLGRLKVRVPSVLGNDVVTGWALPCAPYGGAADQGFLFIPEKDAGVWVEFEEGDLEFPIWVGAFWSKPGGESELPKANGAVQDPPTQKIIKTKKGHTIQLEDADGEEKITIKHKDNSFISIDKAGSVTISNQKGSYLFLNAKNGEASFVHEEGHLLSMTKDGVVVANKDATVIELKGGKVKVVAADMAQIVAKDIVLNSASVALGKDAEEAAVLGTTFAALWNTFIFHTHGTAFGPTTPPMPPTSTLIPGNGLSKSVKVK